MNLLFTSNFTFNTTEHYFSTILPNILQLFVKNGSHGWRESCIWTVPFKRLQEVEFHSIEDNKMFFNIQYKCTEVQIYSFFSKSTPPFLLLHLFRRMSKLSGQALHNCKQAYFRLPPYSLRITSRIHPLIFLWTSKGFISPEYFLNSFSNLYILPWLQKSFKLMVLRLLNNTVLS